MKFCKGFKKSDHLGKLASFIAARLVGIKMMPEISKFMCCSNKRLVTNRGDSIKLDH